MATGNTIDTRLKLLSHSSITLLHSCPRHYQLQKLMPNIQREESIHLYFGSAFGAGMQTFMCTGSYEDAVIAAASAWDGDLFYEEALSSSGKDKTFWHVIMAIEKLVATYQDSLLNEYEVVMYNGKPATELSFRIKLPNGYYYRGHLDLLLRHKLTGQILVLDYKTTGSKYINPAKYANSPQGIGYSIVIDKVLPGTQSFDVCYAEYMTGIKKFELNMFLVSRTDRAKWLKELMVDIHIMELYADTDGGEGWPKHGESCSGYGNKACNMIDVCKFSNASLNIGGDNLITIDGMEYEAEKARAGKGRTQYHVEYDIEVTLDELIEAQLVE